MPTCKHTDAVFALLDAVRALPIMKIDGLEQLANAVMDQLESEAPEGTQNLTGPAFYIFLLAASAKRAAHIFQILTAFVGMAEMNLRPSRMPDDVKKRVEALFYGGGLDIAEVFKALDL